MRIKPLLFLSIFLFTPILYAEVEPGFFTRAQTVLEEFQNKPLILGNWQGRFQPYLYDRELKPLFSTEQTQAYAAFDFFNPKVVGPHHLLMYGEENGIPRQSLFILDAKGKKLHEQALVQTDDLVPNWHAYICAQQSHGRFSFPQKNGQAFYQVNLPEGTITPIAMKNSQPTFIKCFWENDQKLLGVSLSKQGYQLYQCDLNEQIMNCARTKALETFVEFSDFFREQDYVGVIGIKREDTFRKPYVLSKQYDATTPMKIPSQLMGDVVEVRDGYFRMGLLSRYVTNLTPKPAPDVIISKFNQIQGTWYAIATDMNHTPTLAILEKGEWQLQKFNVMPPASSINKPEEVWTTGKSGERYQSYYFGPLTASNVVIWLHGGPQESFSPRFHPYVYQLNQMGYGVLAVNYPGSTGRGVEYEYRRSVASHIDSIHSVLDYLKQKKVEQVITWSISYADKLQKEILENNVSISAMIDYAGILPQDTLKALAAQKNVPYFSIRGKYDHLSQAKSPDFVFVSGGHNMISPHDFKLLFESLTPFLAKTPKWTY